MGIRRRYFKLEFRCRLATRLRKQTTGQQNQLSHFEVGVEERDGVNGGVVVGELFFFMLLLS
jgi:hypothetical protein